MTEFDNGLNNGNRSGSNCLGFGKRVKLWRSVAAMLLLIVTVCMSMILFSGCEEETDDSLSALREEAEQYMQMGQHKEAMEVYRELKKAGDAEGTMHFDVLTGLKRLDERETDKGLRLILSADVPILLKVDNEEAKKIMPDSGFDGLGSPKREGYHFNCWKVTYVYYQYKDTPYVELALESSWQAREYFIGYDLNGGGWDLISPPEKYSVSYDQKLPEPIRIGHIFVGWIGTDLVDPTRNVVIPKGSTGYREYKAIWTPAQYTVSFDLNGGVCDVEKMTVTYGEPFTLPKPTREGMEFRGWYFEGHLAFDSVWTRPDDIELTAKWWEYSITYLMNGGENPEGNPTRFTFGDHLTFKDPTREGYTFLGWTVNDSYEPKKQMGLYPGKRDLEIEAHWKSDTPVTTHRVWYDCAGGTLSVLFHEVEDGCTLKLPIPFSTGLTFVGWHDGEKLIEERRITVTEEMHLTAIWE